MWTQGRKQGARLRWRVAGFPLALLMLWVWTCSPTSGVAAPAQDQPYEHFLTSAERLYDAVNRSNTETVAKRLGEVEHQLRGLPMSTIATAEGIQALARNVTELKRAVASVQPDLGRWKTLSASLRLAADALAHPDKPIWHRYQKVFQEDFAKLAAALPEPASAAGPASKAVLKAFEELSEHYGIVRTAMLLRSEPWKIERTDSVMRYARRIYGADTPPAKLLHGTLAPLREALDEMFPEQKTASGAVVPPLGAAPPSWGWSAMMGSFIVTILTWVGWRRYKYEEFSGRSLPADRTPPKEDAAQRLLRRWRKKD
ncbi:sporulation protein YpjB [Cohnella boryungensis]|uniref:sporulation protein YpjB n=1 Tax=Cohnella boryungensis TaxID=768479 RepID=UPI00195BDB7A